MTWVVLSAVVLLAWSNGSNDNFKGVSTLYGSGSAGYKTALAWAMVTQLAGSLLTLALAAGLVKTFSTRGLVPDAVAASPTFLAAAALGAGLTVLLATVFGLPVSTTHGLTGALIGAGLATGAGVNFGVLGRSFVLPLLLSPVLAMALTAGLYPIARFARKRLGVERESCVCIGAEYVPSPAMTQSALATATDERVRLAVMTGTGEACRADYAGQIVGVSAKRALDAMHFVSAGAVCFARALNDTPKIVGLLLAAKVVSGAAGLPIVGVAMSVGGLVGARKVAETMAKKITQLNAGQGFVTSLTDGASRDRGITLWAAGCRRRMWRRAASSELAPRPARRVGKPSRAILAAWLTTLPLGAVLGAAAFLLMR